MGRVTYIFEFDDKDVKNILECLYSCSLRASYNQLTYDDVELDALRDKIYKQQALQEIRKYFVVTGLFDNGATKEKIEVLVPADNEKEAADSSKRMLEKTSDDFFLPISVRPVGEEMFTRRV